MAVAEAGLAVGVEVDGGAEGARHVTDGHLCETAGADGDVDDILAGAEGERAESLSGGTTRLALVGERTAVEGDRGVVRQAVIVVRVAGVVDGERGVVERDAGARERGRMEELQRAAADRRRAGVSQRAHQRERAAALLVETESAATGVLDQARVGDASVLPGAADDQAHRRSGGVVDDRTRGRQQGETTVAARRGEIADLQAVAIEVERAVIHVDRNGRRVGVGRRGDERRAELERAAVDGDITREEERSVQDERAAVGLGEAARARERGADREVGAGKHVEHRLGAAEAEPLGPDGLARPRREDRAGGERQLTERRRADVRTGAGEREGVERLAQSVTGRAGRGAEHARSLTGEGRVGRRDLERVGENRSV